MRAKFATKLVKNWKFQTLSGKLSWSHYLELIKCDDPMEMQFYMTQAIQEYWLSAIQNQCLTSPRRSFSPFAPDVKERCQWHDYDFHLRHRCSDRLIQNERKK